MTCVCRPAEFRAGCFTTRLLRAKGYYGLFKYNGISVAQRQSTVYRDGASVTIGTANPHWLYTSVSYPYGNSMRLSIVVVYHVVHFMSTERLTTTRPVIYCTSHTHNTVDSNKASRVVLLCSLALLLSVLFSYLLPLLLNLLLSFCRCPSLLFSLLVV